jgi:hypothetical protein
MTNTEAPSAPTGVLKRVVLGRASSSSGLEHTPAAEGPGAAGVRLTLVTRRPHPYVMTIAVAIGSLLILVIGLPPSA